MSCMAYHLPWLLHLSSSCLEFTVFSFLSFQLLKRLIQTQYCRLFSIWTHWKNAWLSRISFQHLPEPCRTFQEQSDFPGSGDFQEKSRTFQEASNSLNWTELCCRCDCVFSVPARQTAVPSRQTEPLNSSLVLSRQHLKLLHHYHYSRCVRYHQTHRLLTKTMTPTHWVKSTSVVY